MDPAAWGRFLVAVFDEWLKRDVGTVFVSHFDSLLEARVLIEDWRIDYNLNRPHSAHGELTPDQFARAWINERQPALA